MTNASLAYLHHCIDLGADAVFNVHNMRRSPLLLFFKIYRDSWLMMHCLDCMDAGVNDNCYQTKETVSKVPSQLSIVLSTLNA